MAGKVDDLKTKKKLDQLHDIRVPDANEVMRRNRYLWPARKKVLLSIIDQQGPCKGSMDDNDKIFAAKKRMQEARK